MWNPSEALDLVIQANIARHNGNDEQALNLIDKAIFLAEEGGSLEYALQWKIQKALLFMKTVTDTSEVIAAVQNALDYQKTRGNRFGQLDLLICKAGIFSNAREIQNARQVLQEAEALLINISSDDVPRDVGIAPDILINMRRDELKRFRLLLES